MDPQLVSIKDDQIRIERANERDIPALVALNKRVYPDEREENVVWRAGHLLNHQRQFPDGQLVARLNDRIIGACASLIVRIEGDPLRPHTFAGMTDGGFFHNHDPQGDTLYAADIYVDPDYRRRGVGHALTEARRQLCRTRNLRRILAGGRLADYARQAPELTPEEYARRVEAGEMRDSVLSFHLREGYCLRGALSAYVSDPASRNCASLLEWLNPDHQPDARGNTKVRVACVQYQVRKVTCFEDFAEQVTYFTDTAADYKSDFVVFPEFFSVQLLSHLDVLSSLEGIRKLAEFTPQFIALLSGLARKHGIHIIGGSHPILEGDKLYNKSLVFFPDGSHVGQPKLHITPSERRYWGISGGDELFVMHSPKVRFAVQICYDIEFPEATRYLADEGAEIIFVPYCTDNRQGFLRVRCCAQARAIENQIYVVTTGIIGNLPQVPAMDIHYGQAAVLTPSDFEFARDGIQAQTDPNVETLLVTDLDIADLHRSRREGSVTPRLDRRHDLFEIRAKLRNISPREADVEKSVPMDLPTD